MALIKCPECGRDVSDRALQCIHCGFPLSELNVTQYDSNDEANGVNICLIDGVKYDLSDVAEKLFALPTGDRFDNEEDREKLGEVQSILRKRIAGLNLISVTALSNEIRNTRTVPKTFDLKQYVFESKKEDNLVHCPRCDSTQIITGQRGYSLMWGFLGSNRTMNRCASCGYKWEPRKW